MKKKPTLKGKQNANRAKQGGGYYNLFEAGKGLGVAHVKTTVRHKGNRIKRRGS